MPGGMLAGFPLSGHATDWLFSGRMLFLLIHLFGVSCFSYIVAKRLTPLLRAERDFRFDRPFTRLTKTLQFWLGQWNHPRYLVAGVLHIVIFIGFLVLPIRSISLVMLGTSGHFQDLSGGVNHFYKSGHQLHVHPCLLRRGNRRDSPGSFQAPALCGTGEIRQGSHV